MLEILKSSFWKVVFGLLTLIFIGLVVGIFTQGSSLSEKAMKNAQRLVLPLNEDVPIIGAQVKVAIKDAPNSVPDEVVIAPIPQTPIEEEAPDLYSPPEPLPNGLEPLTELEDTTVVLNETPQGTEVVVSEALEDELNQEKPAKTETAAIEPSAATEETFQPESSEIEDDEAEIDESEAVETEDSTQADSTASTPPIRIEEQPHGQALASAPFEKITEKLGDYNLPKISDNGIKPWQYYSKPFEDTGKPLVAIIVRGLGLGRITTENSLNLDSHVTLSFSPYAKNAEMWASHARNIGHEVLLDLPQESTEYPAVDPGPYALLNTLGEDTNTDRLRWILNTISGYVGLLQSDNPAPQSRELTNAFKELSKRGIFLIESPQQKTSDVVKHQYQMGLIAESYTTRIDEVLNEESIKRELEFLVKHAKKEGVAIGVTLPYPLSLEIINEWVTQLEEKGVTLAPVSAIIDHEN